MLGVTISFFIQFADPSFAYPAISFLALALIMHSLSALYLTALIFGGNWLSAAFRKRHRAAAAWTAALGALGVGFALKLGTAD